MTAEPHLHQVDVLVLGAGAAGLTAALSIPKNLSVAVLTKDPSGGSTRWAQAGVAVVIDDSDSIESHVDDTLFIETQAIDSSCFRINHRHHLLITCSEGNALKSRFRNKASISLS